MTVNESERRLAEALRAQARSPGRPVTPPRRESPEGTSVQMVLLLWLLGGAVLGTALALLSLLAPWVLPAFG